MISLLLQHLLDFLITSHTKIQSRISILKLPNMGFPMNYWVFNILKIHPRVTYMDSPLDFTTQMTFSLVVISVYISLLENS